MLRAVASTFVDARLHVALTATVLGSLCVYGPEDTDAQRPRRETLHCVEVAPPVWESCPDPGCPTCTTALRYARSAW